MIRIGKDKNGDPTVDFDGDIDDLMTEAMIGLVCLMEVADQHDDDGMAVFRSICDVAQKWYEERRRAKA